VIALKKDIWQFKPSFVRKITFENSFFGENEDNGRRCDIPEGESAPGLGLFCPEPQLQPGEETKTYAIILHDYREKKNCIGGGSKTAREKKNSLKAKFVN